MHALLLGWSAAANSATFDEPAHLAAGAEYWRHGDFSIYSLSPPLLRLWAAAPVVLVGAEAPKPDNVQAIPLHDRHWYYADGFVYGNFNRFAFLLMIARWGMIPLSCFAGWITFRWAAELYGPASGLAACALYCFCPSILAHGSLVTTDAGTMAAIVAASWLWWRFCKKQTAAGWLLVCMALVAAHLCKFTAILLWPMMMIMAIPFALQPGPGRRKILIGFCGSIAMTLLLINAIYGFSGTGRSIGAFHFHSDAMQHLQANLPWHTPSPLPALLMQGLDAQKYDTQSRYSTFLFGHIYPSTVWYFYPAALLCKLPVSVILLGIGAMFSLATRRGRRRCADSIAETSLLASGFVFVAGVILLSDVNIGTRYLLPAFPMVFIAISRLWCVAVGTNSEAEVVATTHPTGKFPTFYISRGVVCNALIVLLAIETSWACPRFLSFINFAAGASSNGAALLSDSDFDWGQSLPDLRNWMHKNGVARVSLAYFGLVDARVYGVNFTPINAGGDEPYVAVSSYYLNGFSNRMVVGQLHRAYLNLDYCKSLQRRKPVAMVGNTIYIFKRADVQAAMAESRSSPVTAQAQ